MGFCESRSGLLGASLKEICSSNMFESLAAEVSPVSRVEGRGEARSRAERLTESRGGERKKKTGESCAQVVVTQLRPSSSRKPRHFQLSQSSADRSDNGGNSFLPLCSSPVSSGGE